MFFRSSVKRAVTLLPELPEANKLASQGFMHSPFTNTSVGFLQVVQSLNVPLLQKSHCEWQF